MTFPLLSAAERPPTEPVSPISPVVPVSPTPVSVSPASNDALKLALNTAFVRSRANAREQARDLQAELAQAGSTPAARAILATVRDLALAEKISEVEAAEQLVHAFRKLDEIWSSYLYQEGVARITSGE